MLLQPFILSYSWHITHYNRLDLCSFSSDTYEWLQINTIVSFVGKNVIGLVEWSTDVLVTGMGLELPIRVEFTTSRSRNHCLNTWHSNSCSMYTNWHCFCDYDYWFINILSVASIIFYFYLSFRILIFKKVQQKVLYREVVVYKSFRGLEPCLVCLRRPVEPVVCWPRYLRRLDLNTIHLDHT